MRLCCIKLPYQRANKYRHEVALNATEYEYLRRANYRVFHYAGARLFSLDT
jgi:hypothetical protein